MTALRPVRCDQCGKICNYADEYGPSVATPLCGCYRELDVVPRCCGTCRYWVPPEFRGGHYRGSDCFHDMRYNTVPAHPQPWGVCGRWEKTDD